MPTRGFVKIGSEVIDGNRDDLFTVLDWGRGVWDHKNYWFWGNGTTYIDGKLFGFEITWGIGAPEKDAKPRSCTTASAINSAKYILNISPTNAGWIRGNSTKKTAGSN